MGPYAASSMTITTRMALSIMNDEIVAACWDLRKYLSSEALRESATSDWLYGRSYYDAELYLCGGYLIATPEIRTKKRVCWHQNLYAFPLQKLFALSRQLIIALISGMNGDGDVVGKTDGDCTDVYRRGTSCPMPSILRFFVPTGR